MFASDAWAPYQPGAGRPWDLALAAHLLRRAGFGANWSQLRQALADGPQAAVDRLLAPPADLESFERRASALEAPSEISESAGAGECAQLWLYRMRETPWPLLEKMTLFWHNYFAVAAERVGKACLMAQHLRLLRRNALGRFDAMLRDISRDPATLIALDARSTLKAKPPEAFAAALLDLYTLGPGLSSASDVREAARAFTGWSVLRDEFHYRESEHDAGAKSGDEVVATVLKNPATARRVVRRLYAWLVSETESPDDALIAPLAESFAKDYDIAKLTGVMLRSNRFFSAASYRQRVKSPVEYALSIATALDAPVAPATLYGQLARLGQRLLDPPTKEGWAGGRRWLNRYTIVGRSNLAAALLAAAKPEKQERVPELLLQNEIKQELTPYALVTLPEFHLS